MTQEEYIASMEAELDELRKKVGSLEDWQRKYKEAVEVWEALDAGDDDHVVGAVLLGKIYNFEKKQADLSIATTDSVDWIDQVGIIAAANLMSQQTPILGNNEDD